MKMPASFVMLVTCMAVLGGCATTRKPQFDYDMRQDFHAYHTYAWIRDEPLIRPASSSSVVISPLSMKRVVDAIEAELAAKGFRKVERSSADVVLAYTLGARNQIEAYSYPEPYAGNWVWGRRYVGSGVDVRMYLEGTLAIDVFDNRSRQPVWHGWVQKKVTERDSRNAAQQIDSAVHLILERFPP